LDGAVAAQIEATHASLRRIWTAVYAARARRHVDDLYALDPDPELADVAPPEVDVARLADGHAFHARHPAPARAQGEPAVPRSLLLPYQALFTARIVYHSTFEWQLHAAFLGLGPIPRAPR